MKFLLASIFLSVAHIAVAEELVSTKTNPTNGHAYVLIRADDPELGISWADANEFAKSIGGHLVVINDEAERQWLIESFPAANDRFDYYYWIGLTDAEEEGAFKWVNGDPVEFTAWQTGLEPNDAGTGEDYVQVYNFAGGAFQWNDLPNRPTFKPKEGNFPISAIVELPEGSESLVLEARGQTFAGHYRCVDGRGNPLEIVETGDEQFEIRTRHWKGIGFWDRKKKRYEGVYRYPGAGPGEYDVVGYHRFEPLGEGKYAVTTVGDLDLPQPTPFIIEPIVDSAHQTEDVNEPELP